MWQIKVETGKILGPDGKEYTPTQEELDMPFQELISKVAIDNFNLGAWDVKIDNAYVAKPSDLPPAGSTVNKVEISARDQGATN